MGLPNVIESINDTVLFAKYQSNQQTYFYRSTDFGRHWMPLPDSVSRYSSLYNPFTLVDGRLYTGGGGKLRFSTDLGLTWQNYEHPATNNNYTYFKTFWRDTVLFDQSLVTLVRALPAGGLDTVWQSPNGKPIWAFHRFNDRFFVWTAENLYYSDDVGLHWTASNLTGFPDTNYPHYLLPAGNRLFAWGYDLDSTRLYQSNDQGGSWTQAGLFANSHPYGYVDIFRSNKALFLVERFTTNNGDSTRLHRLADDGADWQVYQNFFRAERPVIELDSVLVLTNAANALLRSTDAGASWQAAPADGGQLAPGAYFVWPPGAAVAISSYGYTRPDLLHPYQWRPEIGGVYPCVDYSAQYGDSVVVGCAARLQFSFDRGSTWTPLLEVPGAYRSDRFFWDEDGLWGRIFMDGGSMTFLAHWSFSNQAWEDLRPLPSASVPLVKLDHYLFEPTGTNSVAVSTDLGLTWQEINNGFPADALFYTVQAAGNSIFISSEQTTPKYRLVSTDKGVTWQARNGGSIDEIVGRGEKMFALFPPNTFGFSDDGGLKWYYVPDSAIGNQMRIFSDDSLLYFSRQNHLFRNRLSWYHSQHAQVQVFADLDGDGQRDPGEPPFAGAVVYGHSGQAYSDSTGQARLRVANSYDTLRIFPVRPGITTNPPFHAVSGLDTTYVFGIHANNDADLAVQLENQGPVRPGFSSNYTLAVHNWGNLPQTTVLKAVFDPALGFVQADPAPTQVLGDTLCWQLGNLDAFTQRVVTLRFHLLANVPIGTLLHHQAWVYADSLDENPIDNRDSLAEIVVGAYDPNDKQVQPAGNLQPMEVAQGKALTYKIRFQNTGTYAAENVLVLDTIRAELDLRTFQLLNSSHPCSVQFREPGVVAFSFAQINLPDSLSDQAGSHGFVQYSIRPKTNLLLGAQIRNTAHIYFDFNVPIVTNTVETIVAEDSIVIATNEAVQPGFQLRVSPNPFQAVLWAELELPQAGLAYIRLLDATGRILTVGDYPIWQPGIARFQVPVGAWPAGFYWLECRFENTIRRVKLIRQ